MTGPSTFRAASFARLAGVTVRALHHYDRIGLLKPTRNAAGYRVYTTRDLEVLEQIVVLRFLGIPLRDMTTLVGADPALLADRLRVQRATLEHKGCLLQRAIAAIRNLESTLVTGAPASPDLFKRIIEVIAMQDNPDAYTQQYQELVAQKAERLRALTPEARADLKSQSAALVADIRQAMAAGPIGPVAHELGHRWASLLAQVMGRPVAATTLARYQQPWTPAMAAFVDKDVWDFMSEVLAAMPPE